MTIEELQKWTEWFIGVRDMESLRAWAAALEAFPGDLAKLKWWATVIELNRIDRVSKKEDPSVPVKGSS